MQPHIPWLGQTAKLIRERINLKGYNKYHGMNRLTGSKKSGQGKRSGIKGFEAVMKGHVSIEEMRRAYRESLDIVLNRVKRLLDNIPGKSIITSDHGELLGERVMPSSRRLYGHSSGNLSKVSYRPELCEVPWMEIKSGSRRNITSNNPKDNKNIGISQQELDRRLEALGYKTEY